MKALNLVSVNIKNPLPWDTINSTNYHAEGKYSPSLLSSLNKQSKARQASDPQFRYLSELNAIRTLDDDKNRLRLIYKNAVPDLI